MPTRHATGGLSYLGLPTVSGDFQRMMMIRRVDTPQTKSVVSHKHITHSSFPKSLYSNDFFSWNPCRFGMVQQRAV